MFVIFHFDFYIFNWLMSEVSEGSDRFQNSKQEVK